MRMGMMRVRLVLVFYRGMELICVDFGGVRVVVAAAAAAEEEDDDDENDDDDEDEDDEDVAEDVTTDAPLLDELLESDIV